MAESKRLTAYRAARDAERSANIAELKAFIAEQNRPIASAAKKAAPAVNVAAERNAAMLAERERWAAVFASDASRGRERACAKLLSNPKGWSANSIVAMLPELPSNSANYAASAPTAAAMAAWSNAISLNGGEMPADPTGLAAWRRAITANNRSPN